MIRLAIVLSFLAVLVSSPDSALTRIIEILPTNADTTCNEEFENLANKLLPGDTLILRGGIYSQSCRRLITARNGTASRPIVIAAAPRESPILTRPGTPADYRENNLEIENSSYLVIRGIKFRGGDLGVRFIGVNHHVTFEDNEIYETSANALALQSGNSDAMIIRRNHIHHTGLYIGGPVTGEGMYLGCHDNSCRITNSLIAGNYIHHLRSTSGGGNDGIEVKMGSYGNVIRDNVIHDVNVGMQYPCIFVYGGGAAANIVEGNAVWNCGEGIYAVADTVVRNNIVIGSGYGISSYPHAAVAQMRNLTIVNNTIYGGGTCLFLRWRTVINAVLANNAVYCPGSTAVDGLGLFNTQVVMSANYVEGGLNGPTVDSVRFFNGGNANSVFNNPAGANFWPNQGSILRDRGDLTRAAAIDFNHSTRTDPIDIGAYETNGLASNPGWKVQSGFKTLSGQNFRAPAIALTSPANNSVIRSRSTVRITAAAEGDVGVARVEFYVDGAIKCRDLTAPYSCDWSVPWSKSKHHYRLTARAFDTQGNVDISPTVTVTAAR